MRPRQMRHGLSDPPGKSCRGLHASLTIPAQGRQHRLGLNSIGAGGMIRIDNRPPVAGAPTTTAARQASGKAFTLPSTTAKSETQRTGAATASVPLDTLVALQANEDATERKKRQAKRGQELLDGLDRLKVALLSGRVSAGDLARIKANLTARREATDDPRLDEVLAAIELRAAVEIAKLGR